ncbi:MAG: HU family DNA-binding protein [Verrucomicrobiae bacterium]|nr:HU family DNA-binding protein [Verrucomicrobiae bacterium]
MNKAELISVVQRELGGKVSRAAAERAVNAVLSAIRQGIKTGAPVQIIGFGTFRLAKLPARMGRHPRTGEPIPIRATKTVRFSPGRRFKLSL